MSEHKDTTTLALTPISPNSTKRTQYVEKTPLPTYVLAASLAITTKPPPLNARDIGKTVLLLTNWNQPELPQLMTP
jgi:hypothetical protein